MKNSSSLVNTARGQNVVIFAKPNTLISEDAKSRLNEQLPNISLAVPQIMTKKILKQKQTPRKLKEK